MTIEVFYLAGCPNHRAAIERIENVLRTEHVSGKLVQIEVRDSDQAQSLGFLGSPTIRVNGVDIEPSAVPGKILVSAAECTMAKRVRPPWT